MATNGYLSPDGKKSNEKAKRRRSSECESVSLDILKPRTSGGSRLPSLATLGRINIRFSNRDHAGALHRAVLSGKEEDVEFLLNIGKDINAHDDYGKTPLHSAVGTSKLDIVQCLLRHKPDVESRDERDDTPLHTAIRTGNLEIVTALLREGHANPNAYGNAGCTPLHVAAQLDHSNNIAILKLLLNYNARLLSRDHKCMTALAHATLQGNYDIMVCLFEYAKTLGIPKDDVLLEADNDGSSLLHLAVESGVAKVVELCIEEGAVPQTVKASDNSTPVHLASSYGYIDILDILLKSVSFIYESTADKEGKLPIHRAAMSNHPAVLTYLLRQEEDSLNSIDKDGRTPIMLAAQNDCYDAVKVLLENGANVDIKDCDSKTALHHAIGCTVIVKEILKDVKALSLIRAKDRFGNTALHYAARRGCGKDVAIIMLKYRAAAHITNSVGAIPLHEAARYGWLEVVLRLTERRGKRTINCNDVNERTPLHLAAQEGHDDLVEFFLKRGARIESDTNGQTPLHYAAFRGSLKSVQLILHSKYDCLNVMDKNQNTALHMAAKGGHGEIVKFLLLKPDQIVSVNERNQNILDIAIEARQETVAMAIVNQTRWKEVLRNTHHGTRTQFQLLVEHMPDVAKKFLDRCVTYEESPDSEDYKVSYDLRFIQGMPDVNRKDKNIRESLSALHTMVKFQRLACLNHPLCTVLMDIKWRKFGVVCALINQLLYLMYLVFVIIVHKRLVDNIVISNSNSTLGDQDTNPLIWHFMNDVFMATVAIMLIIFCVYNLSKEAFQCFDEGYKYFGNMNNWLEITLYVLTIVALVQPGKDDVAVMAACSFLAFVVLLFYFSKFNFVGLYIVMLKKTVTTVCKVLIILMILVAAFGLSFHILLISPPLDEKPFRFNETWNSLSSTFFMMLGNLDYDNVFLTYKGNPNNQAVLTFLFFAYALLMPIIFLNLLIGLAVGDIDSIRKTAALERYTSQVEHLSQLERAIPTFILKNALVTKLVEYPNRKKNLKVKLINMVVKLLCPKQEEEAETSEEIELKEKVEKQEEQIRELGSLIRRQNTMLEEMKDMLINNNKKTILEETESSTGSQLEFYI